MTIASQPRRSWRRLTRIIIIFSVSLVCLYYYNRPQNDTSTLKVDKKTQPGPKAKSDTSTPLPKAKRPPPGPPPEPRYQWTELWEAKPDGKLVVPIDESGKAVPKTGFARHPLLDLVEEGEKRWEERLQRQSKTLDEAVREYVRRYGRRPPKGFDAWFWYASERGVKLVDEFDAIDRDIKPFLALAPKHIRERLASAAKLQDTYHIKIVDGYADIAAAADFEEQFKAQDLVELISEFAEFLPNMDIHASKHDMGPNIFGDDFRAEVERLISQRDFMSAKNLTRFEWKGRNDRFGLNKACLDDAPAVLEEERGPVQPANETFEFIYSHGKTYDFCQNPSILRNNGIFSISHARESQVLPLFVQCKLRQGGDLQYPSLVQWQDPPLRGTMIPWRERPNSKLFWRGRMTGAHYNKQYGWRHTHRFRLHELAWNKTFADDEVAVLVEEDRKGQKGLRKRVFKRKELNDALLDVGLVGGVFQCDGEDGTCAEIEKSIKTLDPLFGGGNLAKYSLD
ncbi:F-actin-capping protein subunit alpha, partial [Tulasnella sp. 427]